MGFELTIEESSVLYGLLAETTTDVILKTDRAGFVRHASPAIERLGFALSDMLVWPHLCDLIDPACAPGVAATHDAVIAGRQVSKWIEVRTPANDGRSRWFAMQMRGLKDDRGAIYGAISVMRSIEQIRFLEDRVFAAEMTDPLTGLTNRPAFMAMLQHLVDKRVGGCLAVFNIDHFKAINLRYGQSVGDDVLMVFSDFLRSLMRSDDTISRIGDESFGVLLPGSRADRAEALCKRVVSTLASMGRPPRGDTLPVSASAGIAVIGSSLDAAIREAELAVRFARTRGGGAVELADALPGYPSSGPASFELPESS